MKIFAYVISSLIGFAIGHYLLQGAVAAFASILISYHLYLVYLVLTAKHEKGLSFPVGQAILTHMAFLVVLIGLPYLRHQIPYFSLVSLLVPGLAPFETQWLFSGNGPKFNPVEVQQPAVVAEVTSEDQQEFVQYLRQAHRPFKKPGMTIDDEFKVWHADRVRKRATVAAAAGASPGPARQMD